MACSKCHLLFSTSYRDVRLLGLVSINYCACYTTTFDSVAREFQQTSAYMEGDTQSRELNGCGLRCLDSVLQAQLRIRASPPGREQGRREREISLEIKQLECSPHAGRRR